MSNNKMVFWITELNEYPFGEMNIKREKIIEVLRNAKIKCSSIFPKLHQEMKKNTKLSDIVSRFEKTNLEAANILLKELMSINRSTEIRFYTYLAAGSLNIEIINDTRYYDDYLQELIKEPDPTIKTLKAILEYFNPNGLELEDLVNILEEQVSERLNTELLFPILLKMINYYTFIDKNYDYLGYFLNSPIIITLIDLLQTMKRNEVIPVLKEIYLSNIGHSYYEYPCDDRLKVKAFNAITKFDPNFAKEVIIEAIDDSCFEIREKAIEICTAYQFTEIIPQLKEMRQNRFSDIFPDNFGSVIDDALIKLGIPLNDKCYSFAYELVYEEDLVYYDYYVDELYDNYIVDANQSPVFSGEESLRILEFFIYEKVFTLREEEIKNFKPHKNLVVLFSRIFKLHPKTDIKSILTIINSANEKRIASILVHEIQLELENE